MNPALSTAPRDDHDRHPGGPACPLPAAAGAAVRKEIPALDVNCRRFIALSPFVLVATGNEAFDLDASPRGGLPGFVHVTPEGQLLIPDAPGNNRLDSLENIVRTGKLGLLFLIPGVDETLRVNGDAVLSLDPVDIAACTTEKTRPAPGDPRGRARRLPALRQGPSCVRGCGSQTPRSTAACCPRRPDDQRADRLGGGTLRLREAMEKRYEADL